jgi:tetratricopeptide (TPR) repeat protein
MKRMSKNIKINIKAGVLTISGILFLSVYLNAQPDKKFIRKGNREYRKENYSESEIQYRKAEEKSKRSPDAVFNIGDALYRQKKYDDASKQFLDNANMNEDAFRKASAWYNMGNSLLQAQKVKESIDAYKNSLKLDPANMQAKYNLGYAQDLLKKQEQQQKKDQDQDKEDQKKKDDENKKKDQDKKQDQNDKQQQQQQQQEQTISKEDAQRLLNALANDEKNVQEKVKREKAANARVRISKNW